MKLLNSLDFIISIVLKYHTLRKYQRHLPNFSSLVFNNCRQSTLENLACGKSSSMLYGKSSFMLVASSPFNLGSDCLYSTLTWSIAYFPCLIEPFYHLANRFTANMLLLVMEELLWPFLWSVAIVFLSIVISLIDYR